MVRIRKNRREKKKKYSLITCTRTMMDVSKMTSTDADPKGRLMAHFMRKSTHIQAIQFQHTVKLQGKKY